jgi:hypothetical protein
MGYSNRHAVSFSGLKSQSQSGIPPIFFGIQYRDEMVRKCDPGTENPEFKANFRENGAKFLFIIAGISIQF